jgi:hypothetical protein
MLFDFIFETRDLPDSIKALVGRLQIPVLKAAMLDGAFFSKKSHPSRLLVNALAEAGIGWSPTMGQDDPLYRKIEKIVRRVLDDFTDDIGLFDELRKELEDFLSDEERVAELTIQSSADEINQRDHQEIAQVVARAEIERRLREFPAPNFLASFLREKWLGTMTQLYIHEGEESEAWTGGHFGTYFRNSIAIAVPVVIAVVMLTAAVSAAAPVLGWTIVGDAIHGAAGRSFETFLGGGPTRNCHGSCKRSGASGGMQATVVPERVKLFNSTAEVSHVVGELKGGDQVLVVSKVDEQGKNWVEVKAADGLTGWLDSRYLVNQEIVNQSQKLAETLKDIPVQASGRSKASLKLRLVGRLQTVSNVFAIWMTSSGTSIAFVIAFCRAAPRAETTCRYAPAS